MLRRYFGQSDTVAPGDAWLHVYRQLLWIDRTTGLAHCYESDKSQPGRHWYERTLRFHDWLCGRFGGVAPQKLADEIDWLFRMASADMAAYVQRTVERLRARGVEQRAPYAARGFPEPGVDPELSAIIVEGLDAWLREPPPPDALTALTTKVHEQVRGENKRRNLLGEGFEDVLAEIIRRAAPHGTELTILTRPRLNEVPGFNPPAARSKLKRPDLAIIGGKRRRSLVTAKWSVRADREEQFGSDYDGYQRLENAGEPFDYIVLTNEFDAARLVAACDRQFAGRPLFTDVVHVQPDGLLAAYGPNPDYSQAKAAEYIGSGRLASLERWAARW